MNNFVINFQKKRKSVIDYYLNHNILILWELDVKNPSQWSFSLYKIYMFYLCKYFILIIYIHYFIN